MRNLLGHGRGRGLASGRLLGMRRRGAGAPPKRILQPASNMPALPRPRQDHREPVPRLRRRRTRTEVGGNRSRRSRRPRRRRATETPRPRRTVDRGWAARRFLLRDLREGAQDLHPQGSRSSRRLPRVARRSGHGLREADPDARRHRETRGAQGIAAGRHHQDPRLRRPRSGPPEHFRRHPREGRRRDPEESLGPREGTLGRASEAPRRGRAEEDASIFTKIREWFD